MVVYLAYGSTANFRFRGSIAKIYISKERKGHGVRSGPRILEIDQVFRKLSRFSQVLSERERTLVIGLFHCFHIVITVSLYKDHSKMSKLVFRVDNVVTI